jgi:hypothetical protein
MVEKWLSKQIPTHMKQKPQGKIAYEIETNNEDNVKT